MFPKKESRVSSGFTWSKLLAVCCYCFCSCCLLARLIYSCFILSKSNSPPKSAFLSVCAWADWKVPKASGWVYCFAG